jgi:hypothetical protein
MLSNAGSPRGAFPPDYVPFLDVPNWIKRRFGVTVPNGWEQELFGAIRAADPIVHYRVCGIRLIPGWRRECLGQGRIASTLRGLGSRAQAKSWWAPGKRLTSTLQHSPLRVPSSKMEIAPGTPSKCAGPISNGGLNRCSRQLPARSTGDSKPSRVSRKQRRCRPRRTSGHCYPQDC